MSDPIYTLTRFLSEPMVISENHWQAMFERSRALLMPQIDSESGLMTPQTAFPFEVPDSSNDPDRERSYQVDEDGEATLYLVGIIGKRIDPWLARWFGMTDLDRLQQQLRDGGGR